MDRLKETVIDTRPKTPKSVKKVENAIELEALNEHAEDVTDSGCQSCKTVQRSDSILSDSNDVDPLNMKKSNIVYKGMMDLALLTANANQLRFMITYNSKENTFFVSVTLIGLSLIIQVAVGLGLIYKRFMKNRGNRDNADKVGSMLVCGMFCLAVINVLIASFTTTTNIVATP